MPVATAYRLILGRDPTPTEVDGGGPPHSVDPQGLANRLLLSPEFRDAYFALTRDVGSRVTDRYDRALGLVGSDVHFVELLYAYFLGRPADSGGQQHYLESLARGESRVNILRAILCSDEFDYRFVQIAPYVPRDVQLCELANPAKWDNPEWMALFRELRILPDEKPQMHRKGYELTQLLFGLRSLGKLGSDRSVVSVGAGHECVLYWLANHVGRVAATDTYEGPWQAARGREGDQRVLSNPDAYAPFSYRREALSFFRMDGRRLAFRDETFDVAYSLSSIEHFGGLQGAASAIDEMARVVKPGGVVVVATEYRLSGPPYPDVFDGAQIQQLFDRPALRLVEPIDESVYRRYRYMPIDLVRLPYQTPHLVVKVGQTVFTSVIAFLEKRRGSGSGLVRTN
jgi:SAM-dependent methyltransferase